MWPKRQSDLPLQLAVDLLLIFSETSTLGDFRVNNGDCLTTVNVTLLGDWKLVKSPFGPLLI